MQRILITPHFTSDQINRFIITVSFSEYFLSKDFLPIVCAYPIDESSDIELLAEEYLSISDKLVLTGGASHGELPARDKFEQILIKKALQKKLPILGICRGLQILNIALGGTVAQVKSGSEHNKPKPDLKKEKPTDLQDFDLSHIHGITIASDSKLPFLDKNREYKVNSIHSEAIESLASDLKIEAYSEDNVVEMVSDIDKKILAVQWHPEIDLQNPLNQDLLNYWLSL